MRTSWSQPETEIHAHAPGELVQTTLSRSPRVDQLTAHVRDAHCREAAPGALTGRFSPCGSGHPQTLLPI